MATDPRGALDRLIQALQDHLDAVETDQDEETPAVLAASDSLCEAFEAYDEILYDEYGVDTPLVVYDSDDEDEDDDDVDDELADEEHDSSDDDEDADDDGEDDDGYSEFDDDYSEDETEESDYRGDFATGPAGRPRR